MPTLYASIIRLHTLRPGTLQHDTGQWTNAAFYGLINQIDPPLAEALHQWNGRKPFTVSALRGLPRPDGEGGLFLRAGWECWLRVTTLGEDLFLPFIQRFLQGGARPELQLGPLTLGVSEVLTTPGSEAWAGYCEAERLLEAACPAETLTLEFASPAEFHVRDRYELFPMPRLIFGSLATRWNTLDFGGAFPLLDREALEEAAEVVRVSQYRLQSETLRWKGRPQKGFTGRCTYDLRAVPTEVQRIFAALADFAFYAGVGGKTTQGMGQCRRIGEGTQVNRVDI